MLGFLSPIDIANRACQHVGVSRIDYAQGFEEDSKQASEIGFVYDKLRRAELRRNVWRFAIKRAVLRPLTETSRTMAPVMWAGTTAYRCGALVTDVFGGIWISSIEGNVNRPPGYAIGWAPYYGPLAIPQWLSTESYMAGDVVYRPNGDGTYKAYYSLVNDNTAKPYTSEVWDSTVEYRIGDIAAYSAAELILQENTTPILLEAGGYLYREVLSTPPVFRSLIDLNKNNTPVEYAAWSSTYSYSINAKVRGTDGWVYTSQSNANVGTDPTSDFLATKWVRGSMAAWTSDVDTRGNGSRFWQPLECVLQDYRFLTTFSGRTSGISVYRLPANYLRMAPENPRQGSAYSLGAPTNLPYNDWNVEGNFILTKDTGAMMFRFVADHVDVSSMDDMFCEGLGARIGLEVCEPLTQSTAKKQAVASEYQKFMTEARLVNGIETGPTEPPLDDWLQVRY